LPIAPAHKVPEVDVLICGVPFDGGTRFRPGARFGPRAVREASALSCSFSAALGIDIFDEIRAADGGDVAVPTHDVELALRAIVTRVEAIARSGAIVALVGGDQTSTLGALRGIQRAKLRAAGLLHIDSLSNSTAGGTVHHGNVIRHAVEEGLIRRDRVLQVGIRGPYSTSEELAYAMSNGFEIVKIDEVRWDLHAVVSQVRRFVSQGTIYVSVDVSALDPAYAPGVGVPSPGGMTSWELQQLLRALVGADIIGFDVVEIAPAYDQSGISAITGVTILQEILSALADTRRSARPAPSSVGKSRRGRRLSP
jgi:agmatinase